MKNIKFSISELICPVCAGSFFLPRRMNRARPRGHVKDLYCPICREVQKFKEFRHNDYYKNGLGEIIEDEGV